MPELRQTRGRLPVHRTAADGGQDLEVAEAARPGVSEKRRAQPPCKKTGPFIIGGLTGGVNGYKITRSLTLIKSQDGNSVTGNFLIEVKPSAADADGKHSEAGTGGGSMTFKVTFANGSLSFSGAKASTTIPSTSNPPTTP